MSVPELPDGSSRRLVAGMCGEVARELLRLELILMVGLPVGDQVEVCLAGCDAVRRTLDPYDPQNPAHNENQETQGEPS